MNAKSRRTLPLAGTRVLVSRARRQAGKLSDALRKLGARVLEIPFIEIRPPRSYRPLDHALRQTAAYDWLILTSVNGVQALFARMEKRSLRPRVLAGLRIAAIGPATRREIEAHGLRVHAMPPEYVAESVVNVLRKKVKGKRVLLVRAKVARDVIPRELRQAGAEVDVVEAYETVVPKMSRVRLRKALRDPRRCPDVITFTSSSTARNFLALWGRRPLPAGIRFASIGPVTTATLREVGLPVDIEATEYSIPGLVEAIVRAAGL